ncbi:uncharacterized protein K452DRAFT_357923 [Aplosporella prunicola CBS 121167]|uniref:Importin N-terminal domain-containing protein n=1 Tax=Aplosporella prunicola CBS 121167 TaxID=1176127 RepID=A0A6A6BHX6_9PEZI|nr:uncharacterized protein K452DRAFT_357923 [Aplosporella prunicola CBS 121167]KAF2142854.1 hypothetical protein K452DRAFT_357923 [Aplosporella prunicola CBS 121167]
MSEAPVATPTSIAEVEDLVKRLYLHPDPRTIGQIEKELQKLQKSEQGWILADALLSSDDLNVRFFGALTFTVKLTSDWQSLDEDAAGELLLRLINWLVRLVNQGEKDLVTRKLSATLVQYFLCGKSTWTNCIRHLLCSFANGEAVSVADLGQYPDTPQVISSLNATHILPVLWIGETLIQEIKKSTYTREEQAKYETRIDQNCDDIVPVIHYGLAYNGDDSGKLHEDSFNCMAAWAFFVTRNKASEESLRQKKLLQTLILPALQCVHADPDHSVEGLSEMLRKRYELFGAEHLNLVSELIMSPWGQEQLNELLAGEGESQTFTSLLLAFAAAIRVQLVGDSDSWQHIMVIMHQVLRCPGYAVEDDDVCVQALEFWSSYADLLSDPLIEDEYPSLCSSPISADHVLQAAEEYCSKVCLPSQQFDRDTMKGFQSFRLDVADFLETAFAACGERLLKGLVHLALSSLQERDWVKVEASLFCIIALADSIAEDDTWDSTLADFLGSPLFANVFSAEVPSRTRRTAVDLLGRYSVFFIKHTEFLVAPLNFLFTALSAPQTANSAAKSIASLCSACRKSLVPELNNFLQAYQSFLDSPTADPYTKEKVVGAITAIFQALPSDEEKCHYLGILVGYIESDIRASLEHMSQNRVEEAQVAGSSALACLAQMGKALQSPDEDRIGGSAATPIHIINLEADITEASFWNANEAGVDLQTRIVKCMNMMIEILGNYGDIIEAVCDIYKSGFAERAPGPFLFPPIAFANFVLCTTIDTPRLPLVLSTICSFLNAYSDVLREQGDIVSQTKRILEHVVFLLAKLEQPNTDPEVSHSCVESLTQIVRHNALLLLEQPQEAVEFTLVFTIRCIQGADVLPKRAGAAFWSTFLSTANDPTSLAKQASDTVIQVLGPHLMTALIYQVSGEAARSDFEHLIEPLKLLITKQPRSKMWMEAALLSPEFPAPKVEEKDRRWFQKMLVAARGGTSTKSIVTDFWAKCRTSVR